MARTVVCGVCTSLINAFLPSLVSDAGSRWRDGVSQLQTAHLRALQRSLPQLLPSPQTRSHTHRSVRTTLPVQPDLVSQSVSDLRCCYRKSLTEFSSCSALFLLYSSSTIVLNNNDQVHGLILLDIIKTSKNYLYKLRPANTADLIHMTLF